MMGKHITYTLFSSLVSLVLLGCDEQSTSTTRSPSTQSPSTQSPYIQSPSSISATAPATSTIDRTAQPTTATIAVSIKDIMVGAIEPASNAIWAIGMDENIPQSDADWQALEFEVLQLIVASAAVSLGGNGPMDAAWTENSAWQDMTQQMATISADILTAVRTRDYDAALEASNDLVEPCGACHSAFPGESAL